MACNCNNCGNCDCSDSYRVTTGAIGPTGATGPQGPAGPAGDSSYLHAEVYAPASFPGNVGAGYQLLGTGYTLPASTLTTNGDTIIVTVRFRVVALSSDSKLMRVDFGSFQSTVINSFTPVTTSINVNEIKLTISRTGATAQLITEERKKYISQTNVEPGFNNGTAAETLSGTILIRPMVNATSGTNDDIELVSFTVQKITA